MAISTGVLRQLHRIHRQLTDLRSRLERGPKQIRASQAHVQKLEQALADAKEKVTRARMSADQKELQLKERDGHILDVKAKLNSCSSNREYQAFLEQIAADEQANSVLSDEILELLDTITELQEAAATAGAGLAKGKLDLDALRSRVETARESLETDVGRLTEELAQAENKLPGDMKGDYLRVVKARGEEGLAALDGDCCGGCYQTITAQTLNELMLSKPVFCKSCGRLMYLPEDHEAG